MHFLRMPAMLAMLASVLCAGEVELVCVRGGRPVSGLAVRIGDTTAKSDARGRIRLKDLPAGTYAVTALFKKAGPGRFGGEHSLGSITVRDGVLGLELEVPAARTLTGVATDAATGRALEGVQVVLTTGSGLGLGKQTTPRDGRFSFPGLAVGGVRIRAKKPGFREVSRFAAVGPGWPLELALLPIGGHPLPVRRIVVTKNGAPVKGVRAEIEYLSGRSVVVHNLAKGYLRLPPLDREWPDRGPIRRITFIDKQGWRAEVANPASGPFRIVTLHGLTLAGKLVGEQGRPVAGATLLGSFEGGSRLAVTAPDGAFRFEKLDARPFRIKLMGSRLRLARYVAVDVEPGLGALILTAVPALTVKGRIEGLAPGMRARVRCGDRSTVSLEDGRFVVNGIVPGAEVVLQARAKGYLPFLRRIDPRAGPVTMRLRREAALAGLVVDREGLPIAGAVVSLSGNVMRTTVTGEEGAFRLAGLSAGETVTLLVRAAGHAPAILEHLVVGGEVLAVKLLAGATLSGVVRDTEGHPVPGVVVRAVPEKAALAQASQPSSKEGHFEIRDLPAGRVRLELGVSRGMPVYRPARGVADIQVPASGVVFEVLRVHLADLAAGEGIAWASGVKATLRRAEVENRPVLVAINALDNEHGNLTMALQRYRDPDLVAATRPFLCLVASPSDHPGPNGLCARFGRIKCAAHKEVLGWALARWGENGSLTSPQHMILAPDGTLLWRQPYWIETKVLQRRLEIVLKKVAPRRALQLASRTRKTRMEALRKGGDLVAYLHSGDPLAAAVLLLLFEEQGRRRFLAPLRGAGKEDFGLVRLYLEDDPRFLPIAKAIDPERGAWWEAYHAGKALPPPDPVNPELAAAWKKLRAGDRSGLELLLGALDHPVDGPEVRACLQTLTGEDLGRDPDAWRAVLEKK